MSRSGVATALAEQGEREQALQILQVGRAMIARLKARSPDNATLAEDLASSTCRSPRRANEPRNPVLALPLIQPEPES